MNHLVPEQMFSKEEHQAQGISAVKALALASQQGQKIWTINRSNINLALSRINLGADAENDIRNAVNAGKIATAHEARINFNGWVGEGYTLIDPQTGAGGYIISGGGNGGVLLGLGLAAGALLSLTLIAFLDFGPLGKLKALGGVATMVLAQYIAAVALFIASVAIVFIAMAKDKEAAIGLFLGGVTASLAIHSRVGAATNSAKVATIIAEIIGAVSLVLGVSSYGG